MAADCSRSIACLPAPDCSRQQILGTVSLRRAERGRITIRPSRPRVVASAACYALRLHASAAPPRVGLTQALGPMKDILLTATFSTALLAMSTATVAGPRFPSHCNRDEFPVLNATMSRVVQHNGGIRFIKNNKLLSLCADRASEPYNKFTYRYGPLGAPEMERSASAKSKFALCSRSTTPHTGEDIVFFTVGKHTYYVAVATGQGSGVSLLVYESGRKVADLFSGNAEGTDFELGTATINYFRAGSNLFVVKEPKVDF